MHCNRVYATTTNKGYNMNTEKYNGWTNRETWACHLWMTNDSNTQRYFEEISTQILNHKQVENKNLVMSDAIEQWLENCTESAFKGEEKYRGLVEDIGSQWRINLIEISKHYLDKE